MYHLFLNGKCYFFEEDKMVYINENLKILAQEVQKKKKQQKGYQFTSQKYETKKKVKKPPHYK